MFYKMMPKEQNVIKTIHSIGFQTKEFCVRLQLVRNTKIKTDLNLLLWQKKH